MLFGGDRTALRRTFAQAWLRHQQGLPLEPLQARIVEVLLAHPEYHRVVEDAEALQRDYLADGSQTNPFLHMSMHIALVEQSATDRPRGIKKALTRVQRRVANVHEAQHLAMECLGRELWQAQRDGRAPDESSYLKCVQALKKPKR